MARRVVLVLGIVIVALLAAGITLLATSGGGSSLTPDDQTGTPTGTITDGSMLAQGAPTLNNSCCEIEHTQMVASYDKTLSASTQRASVQETATAELLTTVQAATLTQSAARDQTQTQQAALAHTLRGTLRTLDHTLLPGVGIRLYRDDGDGRFTPFAPDAFLTMITTGSGGEYDFGVLEPGLYWLELAYYSLPPALQAAFAPDSSLNRQAAVPVSDPGVFELPARFPTPTSTPTRTPTPSPAATSTSTRTPTVESMPDTPATSSTPPTIPPTRAGPAATLPLLITLTGTPEPGSAQVPPTATPTREMIP